MSILTGIKFSLPSIALLALTTSATHAWQEDESKQAKPSPTEEADLPAGHSQHGQAFNEGPRQRAYLMGGTGKVKFPVTSDVADVQKFVEQGIGQVYGYWYFEAERSFRQAAMLDPACPMAYWGMALANANNSKRAKEFIAKAVKRREAASERERMYLDALNHYLTSGLSRKVRARKLSETYQSISNKFPDDLEAKAMYAYSLFKYRPDLRKSYDDVDRALRKVLDIQELHPVHHFRIHTWDTKDPRRALNSAARCGQSAPSIAHMWHMPGHIYSRLKRYDDAVWQQEASARVDHAQMMRDRVLPDQIHNFAHNNEWLARNLMYVGRWKDAADLAKNMIELPQHPRYNTLRKRGSAYYGRLRLFDVVTKFELWEELIVYATGPHLAPTDRDSEQVKRLRYLGVAYAETGQAAQANQVVAQLEKRLSTSSTSRSSGSSRTRGSSRSRRASKSTIEKAIAAIRGHLALASNDYDSARTELRRAGEDKLTQARVQCLAGDRENAVRSAESYVKSQTNRVRPLARFVELLWLAGMQERAASEFERLRKMSGSIQFGSPVFDRLAPIAESLVLPSDWRTGRNASDSTKRPQLASLGPFRWQPMPAANWLLHDHLGNPVSLKQFQGKPVLMIFYLGYGCLHCAEQLKAFAPRAEQFRQAGIEIVAVSSDDREGLKISLENYDGKEFPFPLVSDAELAVFKAYRAFDDFERTPLHGTFLIDPAGKVQWQDVSFEPFMDADFLLGESKRLLAQARVKAPTRNVAVAAPVAQAEKNGRINPAGIPGALVISGADLPQDALDRFSDLAKSDKASVVVFQLDDDPRSLDAVKRLKETIGKKNGKFELISKPQLSRLTDDDVAQKGDKATGIWLVGTDNKALVEVMSQRQAREIAQNVMQRGGVVGASGNSARYLARAVATPGADKPAMIGWPLLPDAVVDLPSADEDSADEALMAHPGLVVYRLDSDAGLVIRGRRMRHVGAGQSRIHLDGDSVKKPLTIRLGGRNLYADLTALRHAARDRNGPAFPPKKPAPPIVENGTLIIIGGGGMPKGIINRFVELAGGKKASIVVLPTAMPDPVSRQSGIARSFRNAGAKSVTVLPGRTLKDVESDQYLDALRNATGIWFGGGRQWRFADAYLQTKAYQLMHDVLKKGGVIMGSSAGASIQGDYLARANPLGNLDIMAEGYERGMGFLKGVAIDQHFAQRRRFKDMTQLVDRYPQLLGIGIDESTALVVQRNVGTVTGRHSVHFYDRRKPVVSGQADYESVHSSGSFDLVARKILDPGKKAVEKKPDPKPKPKPETAPSRPKPSSADLDKFRRYADSLIKKYDANGDKLLDADERSKMRRDPESADKNKDGKVSADELAEWVKSL